MSRKRAMTKVFLRNARIHLSEKKVDTYNSKIWFTDSTDAYLRLSDYGQQFLTNELKMITYKYSLKILINPEIMHFLTTFINAPFYIAEKYLLVYAEREAIALGFLVDDIKKYGFRKAVQLRTGEYDSTFIIANKQKKQRKSST